MEKTELEMLAEILGLVEELDSLAKQEAEIRDRIEKLAELTAEAIELRDGTPQPVKVKPRPGNRSRTKGHSALSR
jgi:hypothetical protein